VRVVALVATIPRSRTNVEAFGCKRFSSMQNYQVTATEDHVVARCALREMPKIRHPHGWHAPCCLDVPDYARTRSNLCSPMNLEPLNRLADLVANPRESSDIYAAAVDAAILTLQGDRAAILVLDDAGIMRFRAWRGLSGEYRASATGYSPWSPEATDHGSVRVSDTLADPSLGSLRAAIRAEGIRALAYVPLVSQRGLLGGLVVYYDTPRDFSAAEGQIAQVVAHHVALGIDRIRAQAEIAELLERERAARRGAERAQHAAEVSNQAKRDFISILGHELRNPLNAIVNAARVLDAPGQDHVRTRAQEILQRQVAHIARLLDDLLDETRLSLGLVSLRLEAFDVRTIVSLAMEELSHRIAAKELSLQVSLADQAIMVTGDATRLRQVISNLLDNAIKYTSARGSIGLELARDATHAMLRVRDTGVGIPADRLTTIFEPFVQDPQGLARTDGGLGLGLSLVKRVVELHGGSVRAESRGTGAGAEFIVRIPLAATPGRPSAPPHPGS
jgi:signal transduction histidine kinase